MAQFTYHQILKLTYILLKFSFMLPDHCFPYHLLPSSYTSLFVGILINYSMVLYAYIFNLPDGAVLSLPLSLRLSVLFLRSLCLAPGVQLGFAPNCCLYSGPGSNTFTHPLSQGGALTLPLTAQECER